MAYATGAKHRADEEAPTAIVAPFTKRKVARLTTYRRNGTPLGTPVHIAVEDDHISFRTWDTTLHNDPGRVDTEAGHAPVMVIVMTRSPPTGVNAREFVLVRGLTSQ